ncbi:MAG TPA: hypothetical protein VFF28_03450 [Candidatus Nanoarchaeia archaeon]|nr:hypothetical protein [Candidatus Nanoarchaeia archaeon]
MKILVLDYDGVIVDSEPEAFAASMNCYAKFKGKDRLFTVWDIKDIDLKYKTLHEKNKALRPYVSTVDHIYAIMEVIERGIKVENDAQFYNFAANINVPSGFKEEFHRERKRFQEEDFDEWMKSTKPFAQALAGLIAAVKRFDKVVIVTANKNELISPVLEKIGLSYDEIIDTYYSKDKYGAVDSIAETYDADYKDIYFVEDSVFWMEKMIKKGVRCFLATWGYNTEAQRKEADGIGATLLDEKGIVKELR